MDIKRLLLFIVISFSILMGWQWWMQKQYPPVSQLPVSNSDVPTAQLATTKIDSAKAALQKGTRIRIKTDVIEATVDTIGGDLRELTLRESGHDSQPKFTLLTDSEKPHIFVAQTGLVSSQERLLPTHRSLFAVDKTHYELDNNQSQLEVRLRAPEVNGIQVSKVYTLRRGSYLIHIRYEIENKTSAPILLSAYYRLLRDGKEPAGNAHFNSTFYGVATYTAESKLQKNKYEDIVKGKANYPANLNNGWIGMLQHYFAAAWILTPIGQPNICAANMVNACRFEMKQLSDGLFSAGVIVDLPKIDPHSSKQIEVPLFVGPEETDIIKTVAPGFDLVKDYGWFTVISKPLFWVLDQIYHQVHNWGWAIVILTLMIKALFFPLSAASYRSMAKMRTLAPRMQELKARYGEDKLKFQQAVMALYKEEKVNPLGGCLPMLIQIPVFIALYWALLSSVELRQAPWFWITDLSAQDPYYILPLLMAASMFLQTYLSPQSPDPTQAKMMKIMPIAFSILFFFFPAGLVLYWVVNNILSIAQQWYITKNIADAPYKRK